MEYDYRYLVDSQTWDVGFGLECDGADCPVVRIDIVNTMTSATPNVTWRCRSTWKKIEQDWSEQVSRKELFWTILPIVWVFLPFDPWIGILLDESNCLLLIWGACSCSHPLHPLWTVTAYCSTQTHLGVSDSAHLVGYWKGPWVTRHPAIWIAVKLFS